MNSSVSHLSLMIDSLVNMNGEFIHGQVAWVENDHALR